MPQPLTIANELNAKLESLLKTGLQYSAENPQLAEFERGSKALSKVDVAEGYLALAAASMLRGDFVGMRDRYEIAKNQGLSAGQKINYVTTLCHAGFFSEAATIVVNVATNFADPYFAALKAALSFQFKLSSEIVDKAITQGLTPPIDAVEMKDNFSTVTSVAGIDDATLARLADLAGEVMRERHVYFQNFPTLSFCSNDDGDDFVIASFLVSVSFADASEMTLSFAEKLFTRGLANDNFFIRFTGEA